MKTGRKSFMFDKTETVMMKIEGMTCIHCQKRVTDTLKALKGVKSAEVSLEDKTARVQYVPSKIDPAAMTKAVTDAGYTVVD